MLFTKGKKGDIYALCKRFNSKIEVNTILEL